MTLRSNTFDNGPEGGTPNDDNGAGSGDLLYQATPTVKYRASAKTHGAKGLTTTAVAEIATVAVSTSTAPSMAARGYFRVTPQATGDLWMFSIGHRSGGTYVRAAMAYLISGGKIRVCATSAVTPGLWTTTAAVDPTKFYCWDLVCIVGTNTTNGTVKFSYRELGASSPIESYDSGATVNTGTTALTEVQIGRLGTASNVIEFDEIAWDDGATSFIGPIVVPTTNPLTISAQRYLIG